MPSQPSGFVTMPHPWEVVRKAAEPVTAPPERLGMLNSANTLVVDAIRDADGKVTIYAFSQFLSRVRRGEVELDAGSAHDVEAADCAVRNIEAVSGDLVNLGEYAVIFSGVVHVGEGIAQVEQLIESANNLVKV